MAVKTILLRDAPRDTFRWWFDVRKSALKMYQNRRSCSDTRVDGLMTNGI